MKDAEKLKILRECAEKIRAHAVEAYPNECCGALFGHDAAREEGGEKPREVLQIHPLVNRREDSPRNRFSVDPRDLIKAERTAETLGLSLIGWYHSHPDHPARPSEFDRQNAWPWYSYIIVSVQDGVPGEMASWRLREDRERFVQEELHEE